MEKAENRSQTMEQNAAKTEYLEQQRRFLWALMGLAVKNREILEAVRQHTDDCLTAAKELPSPIVAAIESNGRWTFDIRIGAVVSRYSE